MFSRLRKGEDPIKPSYWDKTSTWDSNSEAERS
jgi:hypothetical protein